MKHLILTVLTLAAFSTFAEIYEDYEPSEQHVQLTVVAVEPNYLDDYLVKLKRTWVRGMEIQKNWVISSISPYTRPTALILLMCG